MLNSGKGELLCLEHNANRAEVVCKLPPYLRGLAFHGDVAIVGLGKVRDKKFSVACR